MATSDPERDPRLVHEDRTTEPVAHQMLCAAMARGCTSRIVWQDRDRGISDAALRLLVLNGWRLDHGRWICGEHPGAAVGVTESEGTVRA